MWDNAFLTFSVFELLSFALIPFLIALLFQMCLDLQISLSLLFKCWSRRAFFVQRCLPPLLFQCTLPCFMQCMRKFFDIACVGGLIPYTLGVFCMLVLLISLSNSAFLWKRWFLFWIAGKQLLIHTTIWRLPSFERWLLFSNVEPLICKNAGLFHLNALILTCLRWYFCMHWLSIHNAGPSLFWNADSLWFCNAGHSLWCNAWVPYTLVYICLPWAFISKTWRPLCAVWASSWTCTLDWWIHVFSACSVQSLP